MLVVRWLLSAAAIAIVAWILPGIRSGGGVAGVLTVCIAALFLGLANAIVKPVLMFLSCPLIVLTLGLLLLVINAAMLMLASWASRVVGYALVVDGWGTAIIGSLLITIVTWFLSLFVRERRDKAKLEE